MKINLSQKVVAFYKIHGYTKQMIQEDINDKMTRMVDDYSARMQKEKEQKIVVVERAKKIIT